MERWLHDDCWAFAIAVRDLTGWELGWVRDGAGGVPLHAYAVTPEGRMVDAAGYVDEAEVRRRYRLRKPVFEHVDEGRIGKFGSVEDEAIADAVSDIEAMDVEPFPAIVTARPSAIRWPHNV